MSGKIESKDLINWKEKASELAEDIAEMLSITVGEHTIDNCPVQNAIDEIARVELTVKAAIRHWDQR